MNYTVLRNTIIWWEQQRIAFNVFVGITGLLSIVFLSKDAFTIYEAIGIILWGIIANILYSSGIILEVINQYYWQGRLPIMKFRQVLFIIGTFFYMVVTWFYALAYFTI